MISRSVMIGVLAGREEEILGVREKITRACFSSLFPHIVGHIAST